MRPSLDFRYGCYLSCGFGSSVRFSDFGWRQLEHSTGIQQAYYKQLGNKYHQSLKIKDAHGI